MTGDLYDMVVSIDEGSDPTPGRARYIAEDYSVDYDTLIPDVSAGSLVLGSLQIEFTSSGRLLYPWGYSPWTSWTLCSQSDAAGRRVRGAAAIKLPVGHVVGSSYGIWSLNDTLLEFDPRSGVLHLSNDRISERGFDTATSVEFCEGAVLVLSDGRIIGLSVALSWSGEPTLEGLMP